VFRSQNFSDLGDFIRERYIGVKRSVMDHENCGVIRLQLTPSNQIEFLLEHHRVIKPYENRCDYEQYDTIIWHTHIFDEKIYPSVADIFKAVKTSNKQIRYSYVFTKDGYWQMYTMQHIDHQTFMQYQEALQDVSTRLYEQTTFGREYNERAVLQFMASMNTLFDGVMRFQFFKF
jgi:hypothetical protein